LNRLPLRNDFEEAVFAIHKELPALARKLRRLGAKPALMTGSGSALFGLFQTPAEMRTAASKFPSGNAFPARFVSRREYWAAWRRSLGQPA
ncbi:MAG: hypothetical protein JOZ48_12400, partial [Acidobacteriaceae bacterium]|nr:hypothetical protein [Acidobacteriaceae bacterium]